MEQYFEIIRAVLWNNFKDIPTCSLNILININNSLLKIYSLNHKLKSFTSGSSPVIGITTESFMYVLGFIIGLITNSPRLIHKTQSCTSVVLNGLEFLKQKHHQVLEPVISMNKAIKSNPNQLSNTYNRHQAANNQLPQWFNKKRTKFKKLNHENPKNSKLSPVAAANFDNLYLFTESSDRRSLRWNSSLICWEPPVKISARSNG